MQRHRFWLSVLVVPTLTLMLSGCGQNIFQGLAGESKKSAESLLESGDFSGAIDKANATIATTQTGEACQEAVSIKATALMGQSNSLPKDALQAVSDISNKSDNIIATLDKAFPITPSNSVIVADLLNYADSLGSSTNINVVPEGFSSASSSRSEISNQRINAIPNLTLSPSLNKTAQFRRGFANATVVIKMATQYLDITEGSTGTTVTLNSTAKTVGLHEEGIIIYLTNAPRSILYYAENGIDAFEKSNALSTSQLNSLRKIRSVGLNFNLLRTIHNNGSGTFTAVNYQGASLGLAPIVIDTADTLTTKRIKYAQAFNQIINATSGGN